MTPKAYWSLDEFRNAKTDQEIRDAANHLSRAIMAFYGRDNAETDNVLETECVECKKTIWYNRFDDVIDGVITCPNCGKLKDVGKDENVT